jgi:hypothetical protein
VINLLFKKQYKKTIKINYFEKKFVLQERWRRKEVRVGVGGVCEKCAENLFCEGHIS